MTKGAELFCKCFLCIFLLGILCLDIFSSSKLDYLVLISSIFSSLYSLDFSILKEMDLEKNLFPFCRLLLCVKKLFSFVRSHVLLVGLSMSNIGGLFRESSSVHIHLRLFPIFSSTGFYASSFILTPLIHLELEFCAGL